MDFAKVCGRMLEQKTPQVHGDVFGNEDRWKGGGGEGFQRVIEHKVIMNLRDVN